MTTANDNINVVSTDILMKLTYAVLENRNRLARGAAGKATSAASEPQQYQTCYADQSQHPGCIIIEASALRTMQVYIDLATQTWLAIELAMVGKLISETTAYTLLGSIEGEVALSSALSVKKENWSEKIRALAAYKKKLEEIRDEYNSIITARQAAS